MQMQGIFFGTNNYLRTDVLKKVKEFAKGYFNARIVLKINLPALILR